MRKCQEKPHKSSSLKWGLTNRGILAGTNSDRCHSIPGEKAQQGRGGRAVRECHLVRWDLGCLEETEGKMKGQVLVGFGSSALSF